MLSCDNRLIIPRSSLVFFHSFLGVRGMVERVAKENMELEAMTERLKIFVHSKGMHRYYSFELRVASLSCHKRK